MTKPSTCFLLSTPGARLLPRLRQWLGAADRQGGDLAHRLAAPWKSWPSDLRVELDRLDPACAEVLGSIETPDSATTPVLLADDRWGQAVAALAAVLPRAHFVVCVEHPVEGLAAQLAAGTDADPLRWFADWRQGAQRLLRLVQSQPLRTACFSAAEGRAQPQALAAWLGRQLHLEALPSASWPDAPGPQESGLPRALAWAAWQLDDAGQSLLEELELCCNLLGDVAPPAPLLSFDQLQLAIGQLQDGPKREAGLVSASQRLQQQLQEERQQVASLRQALAHRCDAAEHERKVAHEQVEMLTERLFEAQESLASHFERQDEWVRRLERADVDRAQAAQEIHRLRCDLTSSDAALQQLRERRAAQVRELESQLSAQAEEAQRVKALHAAEVSRLREESAAVRHALQQSQEGSAAQLRELESQLAAQVEESSRVQAREFAQLQECRRLDAALARERSELAAAEERERLMQPHLRQLQGELELLFQSRQGLEVEAGSLRQELATAEQQKQELRAQLLEQQSARAALSEREGLMQTHIRHLQDELERLFLENRSLQHLVRQSVVPGGVQLSISELAVRARRDVSLHRSIDLDLRDVQLGAALLGNFSLRLVEHSGHPGVVLFAGPDVQQLLKQWKPNGEEEGRPFMLLLPSDVGSRSLLETLGASDWAVLQSVLARVQRRLQGSADEDERRWGMLAARLRAQMSELPARLRWDRLDIQPLASDAVPPTLNLDWEHVLFGTREIDRLQLSWVLNGPQAGIRVVVDPHAGAPLAFWPADESGEPLPELWLPLGPSVDPLQAQRSWMALHTGDQDFLLGVLRAWPAEVLQRARELTGAEVDWPAWQRSALRACRRLPTLRSRIGRVARAVGRRLGLARPQPSV